MVIHPGALGDVLLAVPALRALRATFRHAPLALAAQPRIAALLRALGLVDTALAFDTLRLDTLFAEDADERPAAELTRAARVVCWFGAADPGFQRRLLAIAPGAVISPSIPPGGGLVWEYLLRTIAGWVSGSPALHPIAVPPALLTAGRRLLQDAGWDGATRFAIVHPGAGSARKRWPAAAFARVLEDMAAGDPMTPVVHEGPADAEAVAALLAGWRRPALRLRQPELDPLAGALAQAAGYLGNDSGVSHLAAAVGAPAVVLFKPSMLGWRPWASARTVVVDCAGIEDSDVQAVAAEFLVALAPSGPRRARC